MDQYKKHIDDLFREELSDYTESPPAEVWHELRNRLDGEKEKKRVIAWWWYGVAIAIILSGIGLTDHMINLQHNVAMNNVPVAHQQPATAKVINDEVITVTKENVVPDTKNNNVVNNIASPANSEHKTHSKHTHQAKVNTDVLSSNANVVNTMPASVNETKSNAPSVVEHNVEQSSQAGNAVPTTAKFELSVDTRKHKIKIAYSDSNVIKEKMLAQNNPAVTYENDNVATSPVTIKTEGTTLPKINGTNIVAVKTQPVSKTKVATIQKQPVTTNIQGVASTTIPVKKINDKLLNTASKIANNAAKLPVTTALKSLPVNATLKPVDNTIVAKTVKQESYKTFNVERKITPSSANTTKRNVSNEKQDITASANSTSNTDKKTTVLSAKTNTTEVATNMNAVDNKTNNNTGNGVANKSTPTDSIIVKKRFRHIEAGIKLGAESGFQSYTLNSIIGSPYIQYSFTNKLLLIFQPGFKFSQLSNSSVIKPQNYYNITDSGSIGGTTISWVGPGRGTSKNYYYETFDSITVNYHAIKTHWELELPLLLKYNAGGSIMFSVGPVFTFGKVVEIVNNKSQVNVSRVDSTTNSSALVPAAQFYQHPGLPYSLYSPANYQNTSSGIFRFGYYIGMSYVLSKNMMLDLSVQQNISGASNIRNTDIKSLYTQPYFRVSFAYKLFDNMKK